MPNALTMPTFSSVLACFGSILSESIELLERLVRLVRVVVAHAEVGADVDVVRRQLQRLLVPLDRIVVALGIEVEVAELDARLRVRRLALGDRLERVDLRFVEDRGARSLGGVAARARRQPARRAGAAARRSACWLPMIQPGDQAERDAGDAERDRVRSSCGNARSYQAADRTSRYSRTTVSRPTNSAREMMAWPIETSSRNGSAGTTRGCRGRDRGRR